MFKKIFINCCALRLPIDSLQGGENPFVLSRVYDVDWMCQYDMRWWKLFRKEKHSLFSNYLTKSLNTQAQFFFNIFQKVPVRHSVMWNGNKILINQTALETLSFKQKKIPNRQGLTQFPHSYFVCAAKLCGICPFFSLKGSVLYQGANSFHVKIIECEGNSGEFVELVPEHLNYLGPKDLTQYFIRSKVQP